jgi:hypothetical protein
VPNHQSNHPALVLVLELWATLKTEEVNRTNFSVWWQQNLSRSVCPLWLPFFTRIELTIIFQYPIPASQKLHFWFPTLLLSGGWLCPCHTFFIHWPPLKTNDEPSIFFPTENKKNHHMLVEKLKTSRSSDFSPSKRRLLEKK